MHRRKQIWNTETFVVQIYQKVCTTWLLSDNGVGIDQQLNWATLWSHCLHACDILCCFMLSKRGSCWKEIETCCLIMHTNGLRAEASVHGTQALGFIHLHTLSQGNPETLPMGSDLFYSVLNSASVLKLPLWFWLNVETLLLLSLGIPFQATIMWSLVSFHKTGSSGPRNI